ncbi:uncharacterized protein BDV14DRAFT_165010 [Aspergillus stella-maris]|uniref:uncharacterized protein n=1 Tax=Aspergillus stella-maris TaxID=1810926 RepID=UPI003CCDD401
MGCWQKKKARIRSDKACSKSSSAVPVVLKESQSRARTREPRKERTGNWELKTENRRGKEERRVGEVSVGGSTGITVGLVSSGRSSPAVGNNNEYDSRNSRHRGPAKTQTKINTGQQGVIIDSRTIE